MEELIYKPDVYEGKDPYIYMSYHPSDRDQVLTVLQMLNKRGFRFWLNDGIAPGMDTDEVIAEHIENSDFFVAFLSGAYLSCLDTVDELNFSRDVSKEYLLVYLEDVALPYGLDMRFQRAQSVYACAMDPADVFERLKNIQSASRFYGIADERLRPAAQKLFAKLDRLYPEHKVFALDAVAKQLSKQISELYIQAGYPSVERLLRDYGFEQISTDDARILRSSVLYAPGYEPEAVKSRIDTIMNTLSAEYPGKVIVNNLAKSHRSIYKTLLGLSVWMGYDSLASMLNAYGFTGVVSKNGRSAVDHKKIIDILNERYANRRKPDRIAKLFSDNPDLAPGLKTMSNKAYELFGMPLLQYFRSIGLVGEPEKQSPTTKTSLARERLIERLKQCYQTQSRDYGTFEDAQESLKGIVIKENSQKQIYVSSCMSGSGTLRLPIGIDFIAPEAFTGQADITQLILPPGLREIREAAFADCSGIQCIVFSEGIETIGTRAFAGCTSLRQVCFPSSLKYIGTQAFADCDELSEAEFGNPRINIRQDAFEGCIFELESLQDEIASPAEFFELKVDRKNTAKILAYTGDEEVVVVPGMIGGHPITSIEKGCFKGNTHIREVYLDDSISAMGADAFKDCSNLEKVHISNGVTKFTASAFAGCSSLSEVNIPDAMTDVSRGLFKDAPLATVYIGKNVKNLSPDAFYKGEVDAFTGLYLKKKVLENLVVDGENEQFSAEGTTLLSKDGKLLIAELGDPVSADVPEGVEEIGPMAYEKLSALCRITFPTTLKKIGDKAFAGTGITHVEFPPSLETVGIQAFSFCRSMTSVEFCEGLKTIGQQAFEGCPIADVFIPATVESLGSDSFVAISTYQGQVQQKLRIDSANEYLLADGVAMYTKSEEGLVLLKAYHRALRLLPNEVPDEPISYVVKPGTRVIAAHAFARCTNLRSVQLPDGLVSIGDMAFWDCRGLTEIHIPESCMEVSPKAFFGINVEKI